MCRDGSVSIPRHFEPSPADRVWQAVSGRGREAHAMPRTPHLPGVPGTSHCAERVTLLRSRFLPRALNGRCQLKGTVGAQNAEAIVLAPHLLEFVKCEINPFNIQR